MIEKFILKYKRLDGFMSLIFYRNEEEYLLRWFLDVYRGRIRLDVVLSYLVFF